MYLFFFAALFIVFQYMNEKSIFESQESKISTLTTQLEERNDSIAVLINKVEDLNYFTLQGNESAITYLENYQLDSVEVEAMVSDAIYDQNVLEGGNSLVPFAGTYGTMKINKLKFLNHRWIQADFTDGMYWGEVVLEYMFNEKNELEITPISSLLYPSE